MYPRMHPRPPPHPRPPRQLRTPTTVVFSVSDHVFCPHPSSLASLALFPTSPQQRGVRDANYNGIEAVLTKLDTFVAGELRRVLDFHENDMIKSRALKVESYKIAKAKKDDTVKQMNDIVDAHQRMEANKRAYSEQELQQWVETDNRLKEDRAALAVAEANQITQKLAAEKTLTGDKKKCTTAETRSIAAADAQKAKDNSYFDNSEKFIAKVQKKINDGFQDEEASTSDDFDKKSCDDAVRFHARADF